MTEDVKVTNYHNEFDGNGHWEFGFEALVDFFKDEYNHEND